MLAADRYQTATSRAHEPLRSGFFRVAKGMR